MALWIAARDPRTPLAAKIIAGAVAAYALSPIDLIPDFIPVLGYLDDLLIVPLGIWIAVRLIPATLLANTVIVSYRVAKWGDVARHGRMTISPVAQSSRASAP
ncbi:YkvA family protein [Brevundimonas sp.]|uniref:YkvA family protein n=1 Tax=Brevundimonas sp. TaxID=1871086 RepID=UPI003566E01A